MSDDIGGRGTPEESDGGSLHRVAPAAMLPRMELTQRDRDILDFESSWWAESGPTEQLIRDRFELSATRYYQILNELLETSEAYDYRPLVVRRLRRLRDRRRRVRHEGYQASEPPSR